MELWHFVICYNFVTLNPSCNLQETKDGELIILHDLSSFLAASKASPLNATILNDIVESGINLDHADVKVEITAPLDIAYTCPAQQGHYMSQCPFFEH